MEQSQSITFGQALYIINKHAKTAPNPKELYSLKNNTIQKLLNEGHAQKLALHYSPNPRFCYQRTDLLVKIDDFLFHTPPSKEDFSNLPHLGHRAGEYRNPKVFLSLHAAKRFLRDYLGLCPENSPQTNPKKPLFH